MKMRSFLMVAWAAAVLILVGCQNPVGGSSTKKPEGPVDTTYTGKLTANLGGAKALVTKSASATVARTRGAIPREGTASPLAKILEDGSVADVLQTDGSVTLPDIKFIAASPTGDVFVYFSWPLNVANSEGGNSEMQFIKINGDNTIEIVETNVWIQEFRYYNSNNTQKPVAFNDDGSIYYAAWVDNAPVLKRYYNGVSTALTQKIANVNIESFFTDGTNLYFVGRNNSADNKASFLRMVTPEGKTKNAFYDSNGSSWIRAVKRSGTAIYLHGWGIPDATNTAITYNGLLKLTRDASDNFTTTLVVGTSSDSSVTTGNNSASYKLSRSVFPKATDVEPIVKPWFTDGVVPTGIDYYKAITFDRTATEYVEDFASNDERYYWYLLLKDSVGFEKDTLLAGKSGSWYPSLFGTNIEQTILSKLLESSWVSGRELPSDNAMIGVDGKIDSAKFITEYNKGPTRKAMFSSLAVKAGVTLPTRIKSSQWNEAAKNNKAAKAYLDTYFDYKAATKAVQYPYSSTFLRSFTGYTFPQTATFGWDSLTAKYNLTTFDAYIKSIVGASNTTADFGRRTVGGKKFDPNVDAMDASETYYPVVWKAEENDSTKTYDYIGSLGAFRIASYTYDNKNFITNHYTGLKTLDVAFNSGGTINNLFVVTSGASALKAALASKTEAEFINYFKTPTTATTMTLKKFDGTNTIYSVIKADSSKVISENERTLPVTYSASGTVTSSLTTVKYTVGSGSASELNFIKNFFDVSTGSVDWSSWAYFSPSYASASYYRPNENLDANSTGASIDTLDEFKAELVKKMDIASLTAKKNGIVAFDPLTSRLTYDEVNRTVAWEFEEADPLQNYSAKGVLGNYRLVNGATETADDKRWITNLFKDITPKTYDFVTVDETNSDLSNFWSYLGNENAWVGGTWTYYNLYSGSWSGQEWKWRAKYLTADGALDTVAVKAFLKRYSSNPTILNTTVDGINENDYIVYEKDSTTMVDRAKTDKAILAAVLSLPDLPKYPASLAQGVWTYAPDSRWGTGDSLDFNNLENFTVTSTGEIFGLFKKDWNAAIYILARLMTSTGEPIQERLMKDISASGMQISGGAMYFNGANAQGQWFIKMADLTDAKPDEVASNTLLPETENLELFKYNVAHSLGKVFFTGSSMTDNGLKVGWIDTAAPYSVHYQSTDGISKDSSIEVFGADE